MELWIYVSSSDYEPVVFKSRNEALDFAGDELRAYGERWGYDEGDVVDSIAALNKQALEVHSHLGTYLGDLEVDIYQKFI